MKTFQKRLSAILMVIFLGAANLLFAQDDSSQSYKPYNMKDESKPSFGQRLVFGGGLGLQFGDQTFIDVEPLIGYKITPQLIGGIGIKYIYYKVKYYYNTSSYYQYSTNIYGGSVFARYYFIPNVFGHVEYEVLNLEVPNEFPPFGLSRKNIPSLLLGGGYSQELGGNATIGISILYNVIDDPNTPYANPIIKVGFGIGF